MKSEPLAATVGRGCRQIRSAAGVTQDELGRHARTVGLRWSASKVADFERGRSSPSFSTVLAVLLALQMATERDVTLDELFGDGGSVALTEGLDVNAAVLADVCRGEPFRMKKGAWRANTRSASAGEIQALVGGGVDALTKRSGLAEQRLAHRLGVSPARLAATSSALWNRTFSEERDRRAGPDANAQSRGQVSRILRAELEKAISDGDD